MLLSCVILVLLLGSIICICRFVCLVVGKGSVMVVVLGIRLRGVFIVGILMWVILCLLVFLRMVVFVGVVMWFRLCMVMCIWFLFMCMLL